MDQTPTTPEQDTPDEGGQTAYVVIGPDGQPLAIQQAKEAILRGLDAALETGLALETKAIQILFSSQDQKEGMAAFIEKRKPRVQGK